MSLLKNVANEVLRNSLLSFNRVSVFHVEELLVFSFDDQLKEVRVDFVVVVLPSGFVSDVQANSEVLRDFISKNSRPRVL